MWPFKKKQQPKVQLRRSHEGRFTWWSIFIWKRDCFGGYWSYVKGSSDEGEIRALYAAHVEGKAVEDSIIVETR